MSLGDHLDELRNRLFLGIVGFVVACIICFIFGEPISRWFIKPFIDACERREIDHRMYTREIAESFMTYIKIVMITAASLAGPWLLYQVWQFIAAGLYPKERKYITKYLPLSIVLLFTGMAFLYFYVLPLMIEFFLAFNLGVPFKLHNPLKIPGDASTQPTVRLPFFQGDPKTFHPAQFGLTLRRASSRSRQARGKCASSLSAQMPWSRLRLPWRITSTWCSACS